MANNKITTIDTKGRGYLQEERSSMITESRIDHLRSLVKRGRNYERPNWDIVEIITSGGGAAFLFGLGTLLSTDFDRNTQYRFFIAMWVIMIVGVISLIGGLLISKNKAKKHSSCLDEIDKILDKQEALYGYPKDK